jgi:hypothetical protein
MYPPLGDMDFGGGPADGGWGGAQTDIPMGQSPMDGMPPMNDPMGDMPPMNDPMGDMPGAPGDSGGMPIDPGLDAAVAAIDATAAAGMAEQAPDMPEDMGDAAGGEPSQDEPNDVI